MNFLFVHNNFPAQFVHLAQALTNRPGNTVAAIGSHTARQLPGMKLLKYGLGDGDVRATRISFARRFDLECRRAEQVLDALTSLKTDGFSPDVILGHPGWGETLPLRTYSRKRDLFLL